MRQIVQRLLSRLEELTIQDWKIRIQSPRYWMYSLAATPATLIAVIAVLTLWLPTSDAMLAGVTCIVTSVSVDFLAGFLAGVHDGIDERRR